MNYWSNCTKSTLLLLPSDILKNKIKNKKKIKGEKTWEGGKKGDRWKK